MTWSFSRLILLCLFIVAAGCDSTDEVPELAIPADYAFTYVVGCQGTLCSSPHNHTIRIVVSDRLTITEATLLQVGDLTEAQRASLVAGAPTLLDVYRASRSASSAQYDPAYGYPTGYIVSDPYGDADVVDSYQVRDFEPR